MKTLLNIENYGLVLTYDETRVFPYELDVADPCSPRYTTEGFNDLDAALNRTVILIMDPDHVYSMEDLPYEYRRAYQAIARFNEKETVRAFLFSVLEGIAYANKR